MILDCYIHCINDNCLMYLDDNENNNYYSLTNDELNTINT